MHKRGLRLCRPFTAAEASTAEFWLRRHGPLLADIFVTGRTQQVEYEGQLSPTTSIVFGVPQGTHDFNCSRSPVIRLIHCRAKPSSDGSRSHLTPVR